MTAGATKTVWLIEDNDAFRQALARVIKQCETFECAAAFSSCEDALQALGGQPSPDVVLLDVGLPGMSGIDGIKLIKEQAPNAQIVMLTMFDDDEKVFKSICAGASGYLLKTASKEKILEAINVVLEGGAPIQSPCPPPS